MPMNYAGGKAGARSRRTAAARPKTATAAKRAKVVRAEKTTARPGGLRAGIQAPKAPAKGAVGTKGNAKTNKAGYARKSKAAKAYRAGKKAPRRSSSTRMY